MNERQRNTIIFLALTIVSIVLVGTLAQYDLATFGSDIADEINNKLSGDDAEWIPLLDYVRSIIEGSIEGFTIHIGGADKTEETTIFSAHGFFEIYSGGFQIEGMEESLLSIPPFLVIVLMGILGWWSNEDYRMGIALFLVAAVVFSLTVHDVEHYSDEHDLMDAAITVGTDAQSDISTNISTNMWIKSMETMAIILTAVLISLVFAIPIGIMAGKFTAVESVIKPILDAMQSIPPLAYLPIIVAFFTLGVTPAVVATIIFAMPPAIRLTTHGIKNISEEIIEAGHSFGSTPLQMLRKIEIPLALPSIMLGVNQNIMLAFSMAVLAGMVGAAGLGETIIEAINTVNVGVAIEAMVTVLALGIILDRVTRGIGEKLKPEGEEQ